MSLSAGRGPGEVATAAVFPGGTRRLPEPTPGHPQRRMPAGRRQGCAGRARRQDRTRYDFVITMDCYNDIAQQSV